MVHTSVQHIIRDLSLFVRCPNVLNHFYFYHYLNYLIKIILDALTFSCFKNCTWETQLIVFDRVPKWELVLQPNWHPKQELSTNWERISVTVKGGAKCHSLCACIENKCRYRLLTTFGLEYSCDSNWQPVALISNITLTNSKKWHHYFNSTHIHFPKSTPLPLFAPACNFEVGWKFHINKTASIA